MKTISWPVLPGLDLVSIVLSWADEHLPISKENKLDVFSICCRMVPLPSGSTILTGRLFFLCSLKRA